VLQGSVRRAGQSLRITAQLVDAEHDATVWADKYAGSLDDIFAIQEEISRRIVMALKLRVSPSENREIAARPQMDLRAYEYYLRARQELYRWTPDSLERAEDLMRSALEIADENALLYATVGYIHWMHVNSGIAPDESRLARAEECARIALTIESDSYHGIFLRGLVAALKGHVEEGIPDLLIAHGRNPGDASVLVELSRFLFNAGQMETGRKTTATLTRIDPLTDQLAEPSRCPHGGGRVRTCGSRGQEDTQAAGVVLPNLDSPRVAGLPACRRGRRGARDPSGVLPACSGRDVPIACRVSARRTQSRSTRSTACVHTGH
jgi:eukaryotic-like serine/threonine-protein kinase